MALRFARNRAIYRSALCAAGLMVSYSDENERRWKRFRSTLGTNSSCGFQLVKTSCSSTNDADALVRPRMSLEPRLKDKVAIITGASRGFGQAIAIKFVQEGCRVVLLDIRDCDETLEKVGAIDSLGRSVVDIAKYIPCDISDESQVKRAVLAATSHFGPRIDVLVNNACAFVFKSVEDATVSDWTLSMNVNIMGHALVTKHCLPYMKHASARTAAGYGPSILFMGSISSFRGQPNCATYATMKGAIVQLARNCAYDLAKYNIRVNSICAGTIETPISRREREEHGWTYDEWESLKTQDVMLGRVGTTVEVASTAVFFASDESSYCTGTHLMVDGGAAACTVMRNLPRTYNSPLTFAVVPMRILDIKVNAN